MKRWSRRARALGESLVEVLQAELHSLLADFQATGRGAARGLALLFLAGLLVFWSLGLLVTFAVALLATQVGVWQAAGLVFLVVASAGLGVALWGWACLKRLQPPTKIVRSHVDDHVEWWRATLASGQDRRRPDPDAADGGETP